MEARASEAQPSIQTSLFRYARDRNHKPLAVIGYLSIMPTPESESFKASKPVVPPSFDGVDYDDNKALKAAQDSIIREQWVQSMMARLIREEMGKCYRREGVNHLEKCAHLRGRLYHTNTNTGSWLAMRPPTMLI